MLQPERVVTIAIRIKKWKRIKYVLSANSKLSEGIGVYRFRRGDVKSRFLLVEYLSAVTGARRGARTAILRQLRALRAGASSATATARRSSLET